MCRGFNKAQGELLVLDDVNLSLREGEIVGLLGRSGSGKSTLLRIIAGLIEPTGGQVTYRGEPLAGPAKGVAMVFQTFALFPGSPCCRTSKPGWRRRASARSERRERALAAIDLIGLDGFENAYPRELSGGMRQRVGFARALVVDPTLLLMDEPFSALDVLTAETLAYRPARSLDAEASMPIKSVLIVTHNIEEAVFMCDRILVLSSNPGRVMAEIQVPFKHPRNRLDPAFRRLVDDIYAKMTARHIRRGDEEGPRAGQLAAARVDQPDGRPDRDARAPPYHGRADMPEIARSLHLEVDDLFPVAEVLQHLGFCRRARRRHFPDAAGARVRRIGYAGAQDDVRRAFAAARAARGADQEGARTSGRATGRRACASSRNSRIFSRIMPPRKRSTP